MDSYKRLDFTFHGGIGIYSCLSYYYWKNRSMGFLKEDGKIPLLAILIIFLLLCVACVKTNEVFILEPSITYPEERNVVAVPVIAVEIEVLK